MRDFSHQHTFAFDLDNTLVATDIANSLAYRDAINAVLNTTISWDYNCRFTRDNLLAMFPGMLQSQYERIIKTKNERFNAHMGETQINTNLAMVLSELHSSGCNTILLTNCHRERAMSICRHYGIAQYFTGTYFAEDKVDSKYEVLVREGYDLSSVVLFENETEGAQEAMSNGILTNNIIAVKF